MAGLHTNTEPNLNRQCTSAPQQINFTPRQYQLELLETCLARNTIVCLQTGAGKSFLAAMLIKELSHEVRDSTTHKRKMSVLLVDKVSQISQEAQIIRIHSNLRVRECDTTDNKNDLGHDRQKSTLENCQVLVTTGTIFKDILHKGHLDMFKINVMIFDDCHFASSNHPLKEIMRYCGDLLQFGHLRVAGLTSTVLNSKFSPEELEEKLTKLEETLKCTIETATTAQNVSRFGTKPVEKVVYCKPNESLTPFEDKVRQCLMMSLDFLDKYIHGENNTDSQKVQMQKVNSLVEETDPTFVPRQAIFEALSVLNDIGPLGLKLAVPLILRELQKHEKSQNMMVFKRMLIYSSSQLRFVKKIICMSIKPKGNIWSEFLMTSKVRHLFDIISNFKPTETYSNQRYVDIRKDKRKKGIKEIVPQDECGNDYECDSDDDEKEGDNEDEFSSSATSNNCLCGIVFAENRYTVVVLHKLMKKFLKQNPSLNLISSSCIVGHAGVGLGGRGTQTQAQAKKQEIMLRRFRRHETNLLFATSVLEEGVDVPRCNLVIKFDRPRQYRSYIQSKGRARAHSSCFVMLTDEHERREFEQDLAEYRKIDEILQSKCHYRQEHEIRNIDMHTADYLIPPFMPSKGSDTAIVTMSTAISLVNRYCAKLPSDSFTHLTPKCYIRAVGKDKYQATLRMPINSLLRDPVVGPPMSNMSLAKMAVALKTCEKLYDVGELNDNLLPIGKEAILEESGYDIQMEPVKDGEGRPGTTQRRQYYDKAVAECLQDTLPTPNQPCFIFAIRMKLSAPLPSILNVRDRELHLPEETPRCFGILTSKDIPKIPSFPVYTRDGELSVSIEPVTSDASLTAAQINQIQMFHQCVFSDVLRLQKPNIVFKTEKQSASYLIVPLTKGSNHTKLVIEWSFLREVGKCAGHLDQPEALPNYNERGFAFDPTKYTDAVVTPIYRNIDQPQRYFVANILEDKTVCSPFPSDKHEKYIDYFFDRYEIEISNYHQPLLDVDCMSSRLNLLTPRYLNHKGKALPIGSRQAKKSNAQKKQFLVPELSYVYPIPASMWRKAICLPSILYRLNSLLIAEELRVHLATDAKIGCKDLPEDYPFRPLSFGWQGLDMMKFDEKNERNNDLAACPTDGPQTDCPDQGPVFLSGRELQLDDTGCDPSTMLGPSPSVLLQALTMSNASDGFNLERLEMLGDSFLKQAVTVFLYCSFPTLHEGMLSFLRSKQVSNYNLYRLGKRKNLSKLMQVSLFDPSINWLPPGYAVQENTPNLYSVLLEDVEEAVSDDEDSEEGDTSDGFTIGTWDPLTAYGEFDCGHPKNTAFLCDKSDMFNVDYESDFSDEDFTFEETEASVAQMKPNQWTFAVTDPDDVPGLTFSGSKPQTSGDIPELPYEIHTQQCLSDKSVADCVEALIGSCLVSCGFRSALLFLSWIGLKVLPEKQEESFTVKTGNINHEYLSHLPPPLFTKIPNANQQLQSLLTKIGASDFERIIGYSFQDKAYLLQALTHASYHLNQVTDCYQRLEFLGDALLDYLITKHIYDNYQSLSPGALTDLRSALVNNTIFASLAVKFEYHKFFLALSPDLFKVIGQFVTFVKEKNEAIGMESELKLGEIADSDPESEDIEVPKALGDIFESLAGAIYMDSSMSLDTVWSVYYPMMKQQIEQYAANLPISPVRELLEMEPETAKFGPPERTIGGKIRVTVNVVGKGTFKGVGRNYRIAKATAARCALRHLKKL